MGFERLTARATIVLPILDTDWVIDSPPADVGAVVNALFARVGRAEREGRELAAEDVADLNLDDDEQRELFPRVLGEDTYADMTAPGTTVPWDHVQLAAMTTMVWIVSGLDAAVAFFNAGGVAGPPVAPNRAARRAKVVTATKRAAVARKAPRASTAGTTTRTAAAAKVPVSRGRSSSRTGT